jgi:hypothetical protein
MLISGKEANESSQHQAQRQSSEGYESTKEAQMNGSKRGVMKKPRVPSEREGVELKGIFWRRLTFAFVKRRPS